MKHRIAIIGLGGMGTWHLNELETMSEPEVHSDVRDFYRNVVAHLNGEEERLFKLPQVVRVMKLMEAIRASAEKKQVIYLEQ